MSANGANAFDLARLRCFCDESNSKAFALAREFISFAEPKRNGTKEKGFPRRSRPIDSLLRGFFNSPSMARLEISARHQTPGLLRRGKSLSLATFFGSSKKVARQRRKLLLRQGKNSFYSLARTIAQRLFSTAKQTNPGR